MKVVGLASRKVLPDQLPAECGTVEDEQKCSRESDLLKVAKDFSSIFYDIILQSMRKSVVKSDFLNGGNAEKMYQAMLDSEYAKIMAKQDDSGLAHMIAKQLGPTSINSIIDVQNQTSRNRGLAAYRSTQ